MELLWILDLRLSPALKQIPSWSFAQLVKFRSRADRIRHDVLVVLTCWGQTGSGPSTGDVCAVQQNVPGAIVRRPTNRHLPLPQLDSQTRGWSSYGVWSSCVVARDLSCGQSPLVNAKFIHCATEIGIRVEHRSANEAVHINV